MMKLIEMSMKLAVKVYYLMRTLVIMIVMMRSVLMLVLMKLQMQFLVLILLVLAPACVASLSLWVVGLLCLDCLLLWAKALALPLVPKFLRFLVQVFVRPVAPALLVLVWVCVKQLRTGVSCLNAADEMALSKITINVNGSGMLLNVRV